MRGIKQGQRQDGWVVISDGVKAGENVVTTGQKFLFPGAPVAISPGQAPPAAAAPAEASAPAGEKPASSEPKQQQQQHQPESKSSAKTPSSSSSSSEGVARS